MHFRLPLLLITILPSLCFGWGGIGHQAVAIIAEDHLTPAAKAGIRELIGEANISDAEICSWADQIRREQRSTAPWHFVDIPTDAATFDRARDGRNGNNVIDAIDKWTKVLADKSVSKDQRAEALNGVVHLMGDVHQPLHCAERNNDAGGNKRLVFFLDRQKAVNLHFVWDELLLKESMNGRRVLDYATALDRKITKKQLAEWSKGTRETWANETHRAAVEHAYEGVPADGPSPKLGRDYVEKNMPVVDERISRAGVRLAVVLNAAIGQVR